MIDVDKFKAVNDVHGHQGGDLVLAAVAARIRAATRDFDMFGRYGGEEFLVVLGNCPTANAITACERIRAKVQSEAVPSTAGVSVPVSVSIGIATYGPELTTPQALIEVADQALYCAKDNGRNRVEVGAP
jgi:diguanylate cyclase (GGDEF)-like protein